MQLSAVITTVRQVDALYLKNPAGPTMFALSTITSKPHATACFQDSFDYYHNNKAYKNKKEGITIVLSTTRKKNITLIKSILAVFQI